MYSFFFSGEDGDNTKDKSSEDLTETASGDGDEADDQPLDNRSTSTHSSRSATPSEVPPPPPPPVPLIPLATPQKQELEMDLINKVPIMDISRNAVANPELIQTADDDEEDGEEDVGGTEEDAPLDFSVKRATEDESTDDDRSLTPNGLHPPSISQDGPLDLSVPRRRSSRHHDISRLQKMAKLETALSMPSSPWGYNAPKHSSKLLTAKATVSEVPMWNGKVKTEKRDKHLMNTAAAKSAPLNRSAVYHPLLQKNASPPLDTVKMNEIRKSSGNKSDPYRPAGRQNPWQSQWMSRSSEQARDVFTCVWCKESFRSLDDMTIHMKQSPRCGMAGMQSNLSSASPTVSAMNHQQSSHHSAMPAKCSSSSTSAGTAANAVVKENISLPRKLVRGQDVWLGKGAEQTRQILKCMWCGQSFKTLADMTTHMRVTQHYTNIISQEQIISWRTPEDKMAAQSQVNAVLTCKVCDQAFGSLKELSYHMVKNSHYKEHILRSITEGGGRRRQTRERRKKSLPVRKLLELERMELNKQNPTNSSDLSNQAKNEVVDGKISCEECAEKVDAKDFVQHIKNCAQGSRSQQSVKSSSGSDGAKLVTASGDNTETPSTSGTAARTNSSPLSSQETPSEENNKTSGQVIQQDDSMCDSVESTGSTSVLNAIEKLIEKSFDSKGRRNAVSTGILQRLGIDEEVYPPWHPSSSPSTFGVLRSSVDLQRKSTSPLGRLHDYKMDMADFSGSESRSRSSSISEKHPSFDEHLRLSFGLTSKDILNRVSTPSSASQSCSPVHFQPESPVEDRNSVFTTKEAASSNQASTSQAGASHNAASPKDRSATPVSDRDNSEKYTAKDSDLDTPIKDTIKKEPEDVAGDDHETKPPTSDVEKPVDCSREPTPKSEDRHTPISRSSSVEPEQALATSPVNAIPVVNSPTKTPSKSGSRKRKNSEIHRKSHSSSNKRRSSHSGRDKDSEAGNDMDSAMDSPMSSHGSEVTSPLQKHSDTSASDHPLKELQKLLDKTDAHLSRPSLPATPGSILAFSWACSEATTTDSLMKCAFCDTCFISKGAYRHHLSKMHFVKDGSLAEIAAASTWKPTSSSSSGIKSTAPSGGSSNGVAVSASNRASNSTSETGLPASPQKELAPPAPVDESPHSKFLKYTELAKQLSSKYV